MHQAGWAVVFVFATVGRAARGTPPNPERRSTATTDAPAIQLVWLDPQSALPEGSGTVAREVAHIFARLGVRVSWRVGSPEAVDESDAAHVAIPVILMPENPDQRPARKLVMGSVVPAQEPFRCVWIYLAAISATLGRAPDRAGAEVRPLLLWMALARVVAHEVVHAIAPHEAHAAAGLMRETLDREFLVGERAVVDRRCARGLLLALIQGAPAPDPVRSTEPARPQP